MVGVHEKVIYKAFGLNVKSSIILPELPVLNNYNDLVDVEIEVKDLSKVWKELVPIKDKYLVKDNMVLFRIINTATFCIQDGKRIIVSPMKRADEDKIRLFILGTCMGALLIQRKVIPLHGSAIEIKGKAYAIIGESGAGKSTLASAFLKRGYKLLSDDVIAVSFSENNIPYVTPAYPQQKLWDTSLKEFGMNNNKYRPIIERESKFAVPVHSEFSTEVLPLAGIFELVKTESENIELQKIEGIERFRTLFTHTYRNFLIELLDEMEWHFICSTRLIEHQDIFQLSRPISGFTANSLASTILKTIQKEKITC
ncbi:aldolase [Peribacillus frigoritolerans]|uniref:aldolase n=1 Tax=Peribacillus frigoritolerans TaxID=450367 RepID=UPI002E23962E|nr:aldolase [Peribacillus frigoritolerans]